MRAAMILREAAEHVARIVLVTIADSFVAHDVFLSLWCDYSLAHLVEYVEQKLIAAWVEGK